MFKRIWCQLVLVGLIAPPSFAALAGEALILLDRQPPFYAPTALNVTIQCVSDDDHFPKTVKLYLDGNLLRTSGCDVAPYPLNLNQGQYTLKTTAVDVHNHTMNESFLPASVMVAGDIPPQIAMNPVAGGPFIVPAVVPLSVNAGDSDGHVVSVEYFANGQSIGTSTQAPFGLNWSTSVAGQYTITARATDNNGKSTTTYQGVAATVEPTQIAGWIEGVRLNGAGQYEVVGWACTTGRNAPIDVHVYARGPYGGGGVFIGVSHAAQPSEPAIASACRGQGTHYRFAFPLTAQMSAEHPNKKLYIHGISPYGFSHDLLNASGTYSIPGPLSVARRFVYDQHQRLCKTIEPESGATVVAYDGAGNIEWSASGLGLTDATACNHAEAYPSGRRVERSYDGRNRLLQLSFPDGRGNQSWEYHSDGLPKTITTSNESAIAGVVINTYAYDKRRHLTAEAQAQPNWYSWGLGYAYDGTGNLRWQSYPTGIVVDYAPNALGQPTQVASAGQIYASGVKYYPNGAIGQFAYGNGIVHTMAQNARQLPARSVDNGVLDLKTAYDANGNAVEILDGVRGGFYSRWMAYDGLDRLIAAGSCSFGGDCWHRFSYDALDNIKTWSLGGIKNHRYYYDARNQLTNIQNENGASVIGLGYDAQGNLENKNGQNFAFDYGNRLREVLGNERYRYDAQGRRVLSTRLASSQGRLTMYSQAGQLLYSEDHATPAKALEHIYLGGSLLATRQTDWLNTPAIVRYQHTDALGSPVAVTDNAGAVVERTDWEPYGGAIGKPAYAGVGYTGHVMDGGTGLTYMQQRYYDPTIGRFLSIDPVTAYAKPGANFNRYWYGNNSPYRVIDPDGRLGIDCTGTLCDPYLKQGGRMCEMTCVAKAGSGSTAGASRTADTAGTQPDSGPGLNGWKAGAAGIRAVNSGRLLASGLLKFGAGVAFAPTGGGTAPGLLSAGVGAWNVSSSVNNLRNATKLGDEAYTMDSSRYTWQDKARVLIVGGALPFGTLADDPGEPLYHRVIIDKAKNFHDAPVEALLELGTLSL